MSDSNSNVIYIGVPASLAGRLSELVEAGSEKLDDDILALDAGDREAEGYSVEDVNEARQAVNEALELKEIVDGARTSAGNSKALYKLRHLHEDGEENWLFRAPDGFDVPLGHAFGDVPDNEFGRSLSALIRYFGVDFDPELGEGVIVERAPRHPVYAPTIEKLVGNDGQASD